MNAEAIRLRLHELLMAAKRRARINAAKDPLLALGFLREILRTKEWQEYGYDSPLAYVTEELEYSPEQVDTALKAHITMGSWRTAARESLLEYLIVDIGLEDERVEQLVAWSIAEGFENADIYKPSTAK